MKRIIFLVCALLITAGFFVKPVQAAGFEFALGPKLDLGIDFYSGDDWNDYLDASNNNNRPVLAFSFGIIFDMTFFRAGIFGLGFQPEVLFSLNGGGATYDYDTFWEHRIMGIDIPLLVKPKFKLGNGDLYVLLGPVVLIPVGDVHRQWRDGSTEGDSDFDPDYDNDATAGIGVGIGYDITVGPGKLELGILYTGYLSRLIDNYDRFNNKIVFSIGYAFNLVKK
mgnify:CR=1 FL=1